MPSKITLTLDDEDGLNLEVIVFRGADWRQRQRAETLLMLERGSSTKKPQMQLEFMRALY